MRHGGNKHEDAYLLRMNPIYICKYMQTNDPLSKWLCYCKARSRWRRNDRETNGKKETPLYYRTGKVELWKTGRKWIKGSHIRKIITLKSQLRKSHTRKLISNYTLLKIKAFVHFIRWAPFSWACIKEIYFLFLDQRSVLYSSWGHIWAPYGLSPPFDRKTKWFLTVDFPTLW